MSRKTSFDVEILDDHQIRSRAAARDRAGAEPNDKTGVELIAWLMDSAFRIPGFNVRFGFDAIVGLLPGFGDLLNSFVSIFILHYANQRGVSRITLVRMALNIAVDFLLGSIPFLGDLFDVYWKANNRNVELLHRHLSATAYEQRRLRRSDIFFVSVLTMGLILLLVASVFTAISLISWLVATWRNL